VATKASALIVRMTRADEISTAFRDHYYLTESEPDLIEYRAWMDEEINYEWERKGYPVTDVIADAADITNEVAEDIRQVLEARDADDEPSSVGYDKPFDSEAYYEERDIDDEESQSGWLHFEESLTTEARYFNPAAEAVLTSTFEGIAEHKTHEGQPIIIDAGPGTGLTFLYRARVFQSVVELEEALKRPDLEVGPPPSTSASHGRMNAHGVSVFYAATSPTIALAEVRPPIDSRVVVGRLEITRPIRVLDIEALRKLNVEGSIFDPMYIERLRKTKFLRWLSRRISQPVMPNDEPFDYLPTQAIADYLATQGEPELDGILYPSVQGTGGANVVLFHKASRVQELDIPEGAELEAYSYTYTDEGRETEYSVFENVPTVGEAQPAVIDPVLMIPLGAGGPPDSDDRQVTLALNIDALEVHHVRVISFKTDTHKVSRQRLEKH
jgi:RES domain-containing protein